MSTLLPAPNVKDVQEFQFKLLARLRLFKKDQNLPLKQSLSLVTAASKFGLICVGTSSGFDVIQTANIVDQCTGLKKQAAEVTDFPRRHFALGAQPSHLDVSCDCQYLAIGCASNGAYVIRIYDIGSLTALTERVVHEVRLSAPLQALSWNPGIPNLLAACLQDESVFVYEFKNNSFDMNCIPVESRSTCLCWSPKGKQIVIGSKNGALNQFKPDLKIVKCIPPPQGEVSVVSVHWLSSFQYVAVYCAAGSGPSLVIVNTPRNQPVTYINYEDITFSRGDKRITQFYFIHQQAWNVLLVGSANSMEVGVLGLQADWEQFQIDDTARAELPYSLSKQETLPVGMALDTSVQFNLPWGENQQLPAMPLLLLLSHEGLLILYWTVNMLPGAPTVCEPPTPLRDTSGLHLFLSPERQSQELIQTQMNTSSQSHGVEIPQASVVPLPSVPSQPVSFDAALVTTTSPQWQQPPPTSQPVWIPTTTLTAPKAESKLSTSGPWIPSTTAQPTFISLATQSAFSAASPAFDITSSTAAPSAFSVTSTVHPAFNMVLSY